MNIIRRILAIIYEISTYEKGNGKNIIRSKVLWVNIIALLSIVAGKYAGYEMTSEEQMSFIAVINIILRLITKEEAGLIERKTEHNKTIIGDTCDK